VRTGEEDLLHLAHAAAEVLRTGNNERPCALGAEHGVHQHERHPAAVIAMQMGEEDRVDRIVLDALLRHGDQRRGAEIHAEAGLRAIDHDAGLEPTAAAEGVAGADEPNGDRHRRFPC
jgi:hypothetical protein